MGHIELARWADALLIAPATADFIARLTQGRADDLLSAVCAGLRGSGGRCPGHEPCHVGESGHACQHRPRCARAVSTCSDRRWASRPAAKPVRAGCWSRPNWSSAAAGLFETGALAGTRVLVTAGPTREAIDPVRYISNHSSGRMGFAVAQAAVEAGAGVTLVCGPVSLATPPRVQAHRRRQRRGDAARGDATRW